MPTWTRERIIEEVKQAAVQIDEPLSRTAFCRRSGLTQHDLYGLFPGGWTEVRQLAGIAKHPYDRRRFQAITDEELLQEFHRVVCEIGAIPTFYRFDALGRRHKSNLLQRRFGGKPGLVRHYRQWLQKNHPESAFLQLLSGNSQNGMEATPVLPKLLAGKQHWSKGPGPVYGAPINFRGLRHGPTNELGVVYLFGMVSAELGISVEAVQSSFPDCQAKRCIDDRQDRWQQVRIEFEFTSSNFRDHGHDPAGCDLIVCWEHDWPDCPSEVLELRSVIAKLNGCSLS